MDRAALLRRVAALGAAGVVPVAIVEAAHGAYYADAGRGSGRRLPFVGQDAYAAGYGMGERIARLVPRGDLGLFASTPETVEVTATLAGVRAALAGRSGTVRVVETGADV